MATAPDIAPGFYAYDPGRHLNVFDAYVARDCRRFDRVGDALAVAGDRLAVVRLTVRRAAPDVPPPARQTRRSRKPLVS